MRPLLLFATLAEAQATLAGSGSHPISDHRWSCKEFDLLITGIGSLETTYRLMEQPIKACQPWWNLGCAGASAHEPGAWVEIGYCCKSLERARSHQHTRDFFDTIFPSIQLNTGFPTILMSVDAPLHERSYLSNALGRADCVDMEGYALAYLASKRKQPLRIVKIISDRLESDGHEMIRAQLPQLSLKLWERVQHMQQEGLKAPIPLIRR